jgi:hypothetical protein
VSPGGEGPETVPEALVKPAPIIVTKVDNQGTATRSDDRLLPGARFEIRKDDGDGKFEKTDKLVFQGVADRGFLVFKSPPEGVNWVLEVDAPPGYDTAKPVLVRYSPSETENCVQIANKQRCRRDDDGSGGVLLVVIPDSPVELPRTDTAGGSTVDVLPLPDVFRRRHLGG